jgi:hypothetical protein
MLLQGVNRNLDFAKRRNRSKGKANIGGSLTKAGC